MSGDRSRERTDHAGGDDPDCGEPGCDRSADFWRFDPAAEEWWPTCRRHARTLHPSLEVGAWLESGYLKPAELGRPEGPPLVPEEPRARALREEVDATMGWD